MNGRIRILSVNTAMAQRVTVADGRTILPWTDIAARQLVLLACRRSAG